MNRIMVVDDEAAVSTQLEERLNLMGYNVVARASSGDEALEYAKSLKPDLILMDIVMPGNIDGIMASSIINKELGIPVIFLTAYADNDIVEKAKLAEPYGYILKPFDIRSVKASIEIALQRKERETAPDFSHKRPGLIHGPDINPPLPKNERSTSSDLMEMAAGLLFFSAWIDSRGKIGHMYFPSSDFFKDVKSGEFPGMSIEDLFPAEYREGIKDNIQKILNRKGRGTPVVKDMISAFGKKIVLLYITVPSELSSEYTASVMGIDITDIFDKTEELALSLKSRDVFIHELNHRIKNNLSLVTSTISLQSEYVEDRVFQEKLYEIMNRIHAISLLHDRLHLGNDLSKIDISSYIEDLAHNIFRSFAEEKRYVKLAFDLDEIIICTKDAVTIGLIVNELIINSLKHAFPGDNPGGEVQIGLKRKKPGGCVLTIKDNGVGLPDNYNVKKKGKSLGIDLVFALIKQLDGEYEIIRKKGTVFKIKLKLDEL